MRTDVVIDDARGASDIAAAKGLFEAYAASLDVDLCFQNFAHELATLPGDYASPMGCLLLARVRDGAVGCVALRPLANRTGEIKRLYVDPTWHGAGIGRALADAVIARARAIGYDEVKLDTLATMRAARALYASLGFRDCTPYYDNPLPGVAYMSLALAR
ncbi:MAG TPA: GNAT family N-acetyltransferase [Casimicrobiaceae bacterium]|nr:GNAT family N-acetyltransferase [Casimicrobiaceae bacterium]